MTSRPGVSVAQALAAATETHGLELGANALDRTPGLFRRWFPGQAALVVADPNTFSVAGQKIQGQLTAAQLAGREPFLFCEPGLHAEYGCVEHLERVLNAAPGLVPVAVGSGTINDLVKLAAHRAGRRYLAVATAASMDGYTAFGASISFQGSKQTFACPAPLAVVADLDVIAGAPPEMNAAGYADLLAKTCGGADWLLADALSAEPLHPQAWRIVQGGLRNALADPQGVRRAVPEALRRLAEGLLLSGFAMQAAGSSRPASGAEHQFSHLWDMQHHTHQGRIPLHGFKVAIGTLASTALYEYLLEQPLEALDVERCCGQWQDPDTALAPLLNSFGAPDLVAVAQQESRAKAIAVPALRRQLETLRGLWPHLRSRLREQLLPLNDLKQKLQQAGAPITPEQIGISRERFRQSFRLAWSIRRRFTILDVAARTGLLDPAVDQILDRLQ